VRFRSTIPARFRSATAARSSLGALGVTQRSLVEAVDLHLQAVKAEAEEVRVECPRRVDRQPSAAVLRVDHEAAHRRDA
jgi:hypothetical protein